MYAASGFLVSHNGAAESNGWFVPEVLACDTELCCRNARDGGRQASQRQNTKNTTSASNRTTLFALVLVLLLALPVVVLLLLPVVLLLLSMPGYVHTH